MHRGRLATVADRSQSRFKGGDLSPASSRHSAGRQTSHASALVTHKAGAAALLDPLQI